MAGATAQTAFDRRLTLRSMAVVAAVVAAVGLLGAGVAVSDEDGEGDEIQHAALGDSYSSGQGAGDYVEGTEAPWQGGDGCYRSEHAYAHGLLERAGLDPGDTDLVACGGATAAGLVAGADDPDSAPQPAHGQLEALSDDTDLVTLTIGGNDAGFAEVLTACHAAEGCDELFAAHSDDGENLVTQRIAAAFHDVVGALEAIKDEAEDAAVVLVEYPRLFDPEAESTSALAEHKLKWLDERNAELNAMLDHAAATAGVTFVDGVADAFDGHEVNADEPWIHGADPATLPDSGTAEWFHPTEEGQEAIREAVADELAEDEHDDELPDNPAPEDHAEHYPDEALAPTIAPLRWNEGTLPAHVRPGEQLEGRITAEPIAADATYDVVLHPGDVTLASDVGADSDGELTVDAEMPEDVPDGFGALVVEGAGHEGEPVVLVGPAIIGDLPVSLPDRIDRLAGPERAATAADVAADAFDRSHAAVLASSEEHADALAGGPLAATLDAPLLLTDEDELAEPTEEALGDLEVSEVTIVGGDEAVSEEVAAEVEALDIDGVEIHREAGEDRYETAAAVAEAIAAASEDGPDRVFLAASDTVLPGTGWPDAVSVGAYAGASEAPVLLTKTDELPDATADALTDLEPSEEAIVAGGPVVVHKAVRDEVAALVEDAVTRRLAGATRYGTSSAVASDAVEGGVLDPAEVWVTTGRHWADALAAGPAAARNDASLVLVDGTDPLRSPATLLWLSRQDTATERLVLVGGEQAIDASFVEPVAD